MGGAQGGRVGGGRVDSTCDVTSPLLATTAATATTGGRNRESGWTRGGKQLNDARLISKWDTVTSYQQRNWEGGVGRESKRRHPDPISSLPWNGFASPAGSPRIAQGQPGSPGVCRKGWRIPKNLISRRIPFYSPGLPMYPTILSKNPKESQRILNESSKKP